MKIDPAALRAAAPRVQQALASDLAFEDGRPSRIPAWLEQVAATAEAWLVALRANDAEPEAVYAVAQLLRAVGPWPATELSGRHQIAARTAEAHGDLHVRGNLVVLGNLVVAGDLVVDGLVTDCDPDSRVAVAGSVRCRSVASNGAFYVGRDLEATDAVYAHDHDKSLLVGGAIRTQVFLGDGHDVRCGGEIEAAVGFLDDLSSMHQDPEIHDRVHAALFEGAITAERILDRAALLAALAAGRTLLRTAAT